MDDLLNAPAMYERHLHARTIANLGSKTENNESSSKLGTFSRYMSKKLLKPAFSSSVIPSSGVPSVDEGEQKQQTCSSASSLISLDPQKKTPGLSSKNTEIPGELLVKCRWKCVYDYFSAFYSYGDRGDTFVERSENYSEGNYEVSAVSFIDLFTTHTGAAPSSMFHAPFLLITFSASSLLFTLDGALAAVYGVPLISKVPSVYDLSNVFNHQCTAECGMNLSAMVVEPHPPPSFVCPLPSYTLMYPPFPVVIPPQTLPISDSSLLGSLTQMLFVVFDISLIYFLIYH
jgi:hypothetical protein